MPLEDSIEKDVKEIITKAISKTLIIENRISITDEKSLVKDFGADSLDLTEVHLEIENGLEKSKYKISSIKDPTDLDQMPLNIGEYRAYVVEEVKRILSER
jgi:acyl carrier protein